MLHESGFWLYVSDGHRAVVYSWVSVVAALLVDAVAIAAAVSTLGCDRYAACKLATTACSRSARATCENGNNCK
jgi:hypothetical protein